MSYTDMPTLPRIKDAMDRVDASAAREADTIMAAVSNAAFCRARQLGRNHLTPDDATRVRVAHKVIMLMGGPDLDTASNVAVQAQPPTHDDAALGAMEQALFPQAQATE